MRSRCFPGTARSGLGSFEGSELGDYLQSVHDFDRAFGVLVDRLRAASLLDTSIVVLYGDHRGYRGHEQPLARLFSVDAGAERDMWLLERRVPLPDPPA
jgi:phosphoglycerol transferase MdoB-like AlkP superfamily enzyme